ncbi:PQQ-binding-like beta-propeller repeat protein [Streptomyces sp. N2-109]|uniref:PQQ-binding-like beta-propeller repeat protein n=1 Tax=Streptomyces gossypii TaxID=2883101 RepID=A0ABT2JMN6_9ACTN|nr:PQQ-binding-like beta-propeller repeat protein [Streptomyces gossypii]MCT2589148.1 PQQ-binding-like beta-propeller repeat protein [Streptomyces gossypii]
MSMGIVRAAAMVRDVWSGLSGGGVAEFSVFTALEAGDPRRIGKYRIVARLGAGGMGRVFLGRSPGGRALAVKVVREELAEDAAFRQRFTREVATARRVTGFFTATVVDADPQGTPAWLATEYVPGMHLGDAVAAHGRWPEASVLALGAGLAEALEAIHDAGVIHRDLKPSNVLLAPDGPRVIDFGISAAAEMSALTQSGTVVGTPGFMSPEQLASGEPVRPASDVFSLGAVLAFAATGSGPFGAGAAQALNYRIVHEQPDLRALPPVLGAVVARCLAKEPGQRPAVASLVEEFDGAFREGAQEGPRFLSGHSWLPQPVAEALQEHRRVGAGAGGGGDPAAPHSPTRTSEPVGPARPPAPVHPPTALASPAPAPPASSPSSPAIPPDVPPPGRTRRRALLSLAGLATAGVGYTGFQLLGGNGADSGGDSSGDGPATRSRKSGTQRWSLPGFVVTTNAELVDGTLHVGGGVPHTVYALDPATGEERGAFPVKEAVESLAAADGLVYVGAYDGVVYALDAATGKQRWTFRTKSDKTAPSLTAAGGTVYAGSGEADLHALDGATGEQRWAVPFPDRDWLPPAPPAVVRGTVYLGTSGGRLHALDTGTGKRRWAFPTRESVRSTAKVAGDTVHLADNGGNLYALDAATGRQRWIFSTRAGWASSPAVTESTVFTCDVEGKLYAVDAATGKQRWTLPTQGKAPEPVVAEGTVCVAGGDGLLYAVDAATGKQRWAYQTEAVTGSDKDKPKAALLSTPVIADGAVYCSVRGHRGLKEDYSLYAVTL